MGRQRNNTQMKGKGEVSETMINEKEASQLSDTEFKELVIRKLYELTQNYKKRQGNYNEITVNYINMKKEIETINKGQEEMKDTVSEQKDTNPCVLVHKKSTRNQKQAKRSRGLDQRAGGQGRKKHPE